MQILHKKQSCPNLAPPYFVHTFWGIYPNDIRLHRSVLGFQVKENNGGSLRSLKGYVNDFVGGGRGGGKGVQGDDLKASECFGWFFFMD